MKKIGMIGGLSWESTVEYYKIMNREVAARLGGAHSSEIMMYSFNFQEIIKLLDREDYNGVGLMMVQKAKLLEDSGAECLVLSANTAHWWAEDIQAAINIPLIHIADATGKAILEKGLKRLALLGTRFTMERDFITSKLENDFDLDIKVPGPEDRKIIHEIIYNELTRGVINDSSRAAMISIMNSMKDMDGVILACTELPLLIKPENTNLILFNTTEIHAKAAVDFALS
jgi:aspartate racemase